MKLKKQILLLLKNNTLEPAEIAAEGFLMAENIADAVILMQTTCRLLLNQFNMLREERYLPLYRGYKLWLWFTECCFY